MTTMREVLDALSAELTARGVRHEPIDSQPEREPGVPPYITVSDQDGRTRRIHAHLAYDWLLLGQRARRLLVGLPAGRRSRGNSRAGAPDRLARRPKTPALSSLGSRNSKQEPDIGCLEKRGTPPGKPEHRLPAGDPGTEQCRPGRHGPATERAAR